ncbi:MAG: quinolinate synthase NadA [Planctomycetaceae bacterium]|nr:quinolinate synthase NadA [Planctomycetaceae bacterium]
MAETSAGVKPLSLAEYTTLTNDELDTRIKAVREMLGDRLLILGHHYQRSEIIRHVDLTGDSFALSQAASQNRACDFIVFCGVHFMAETADVLANAPKNLAARDGRRVFVALADAEAGCPMADTASLEQVETAWAELAGHFDTTRIIPVTYVNSTAAIKAFCGRHGGLACTSSNAMAVLQWAFEHGNRVLFLPDQMLGQNTARNMGIPREQTCLWNREQEQLQPQTPGAGLTDCRVILWDGACPVHLKFEPGAVAKSRHDLQDVKVIVHPECYPEVVGQADFAGSTSMIIDMIAASESGSRWAIGTEWHLVERLAGQYPDRTVTTLGRVEAVCDTMAQTQPANLCHVLEHIAAGTPINQVAVDEAIAPDARVCLERMLAAR